MSLVSDTSSARKRVLVLGGRGFIGRHAVKHLLRQGAHVTIGTRSPSTDERDRVMQERFVLHQSQSPDDWGEVAGRFDTILNCVGILRQRPGETYEAVHHLAPKAIAKACAAASCRFVHVSALGLSSDARSRFLTSKHRGEHAIAEHGDDWIVARLSLLDGEGGYGAAWLRGVSRLPVFVVPSSAKGEIAALTADDAGEALARLSRAPASELRLQDSRVFELGGIHPVDFEAYIRALRKRYKTRPAVCIRLPGIFARLGAHVCDLFHFSPFSFGHWELLRKDNVPAPNRLEELLNRKPTRVIDIRSGR